jgi:hypothetical protein
MSALGNRPPLNFPRHLVGGVQRVCHAALPLVHPTYTWQARGLYREASHYSLSKFHTLTKANGHGRDSTFPLRLDYRRLATPTLCEEAPVVSQRLETGVQSFDYTALAACVRELKDKWTPAKIDQVGAVFRTSRALCQNMTILLYAEL